MSEPFITQEPATIEGLAETDIPSIDAIFITRFDTRQGNVLEWCDAVPDLALNNVEFASLPSGLHNTTEDVIYFRLEGCMGLAVYVNVESNRAEHRGAQMIALGILVKPSAETGRCGQVWRHIQFLKSQVRSHVEQNADTEILSEYFNAHKTQPPPPGSPSSNKRDSFSMFNRRRINRSFTLSEPLIIPPQYLGDMPESQESEEIHASHPSHYYLEHVLAMGPSIFVLWKAALLKKRILIYTPPPVETACLAVYNTCLLATIPFGTVAPRVKSGDRIQPLFCVGIHDMDTMMKATSGYVACTTDKLFLFKPQLFDVLVEIPASQPSQETYQLPKQTGPKISLVRESRGERSLKEVSPQLVDNRRYFTLFQQMNRSRRRQCSIQRRLRAESSNMGTDYAWRGAHPENNDGALARESTLEVSHETGFKMSDTLKKMVTGGWWWWYGSDENEEEYQPFLQENEQSHAAQDIVPDQRLSGAHLQILQRPHADSDTEAIRFFHQLTQTLLSDLGRLISYKETAAIFSQEDHDDDDEGAHPVEITKEDMRDLGLDPQNDTEFVQELAQMYFGTQVEVQGGGLLWGCSQVLCCNLCR
ncbi:hypothetical protein CPB97_005433 [Podila verticillata]|nr:hypothetical protein CPB97_005433 [Podila verticillata]